MPRYIIREWTCLSTKRAPAGFDCVPGMPWYIHNLSPFVSTNRSVNSQTLDELLSFDPETSWRPHVACHLIPKLVCTATASRNETLKNYLHSVPLKSLSILPCLKHLKHIDTQYCPGLELNQRDYSFFVFSPNYAETERNIKAQNVAMSV
ncbi:hypothetical protein BJV74DRAFT_247821 [Russula compacta]|nr:hypothetical protein BJV74DRAFT_247821 [Russula compacta]